MAFRVLGLNPVRAAINPKGVAAGLSSSRPLVRPVLSTNERDMIVNLRKVHYLLYLEREVTHLLSLQYRTRSNLFSLSLKLVRLFKSSVHVSCLCMDVQTHRLAHIVFQRILAANPTEESVPDFKHKLKNIFSKISGGELNPCKGN